MYALSKQVDGLVNKIAQGGPTILVSGRENLDDGDDTAKMVFDNDAIAPVRVNLIC